MRAMLASNPLADRATEVFAQALYGMPVHALNPGVAHAVASRYRSLGALMAMLLDPSRSVHLLSVCSAAELQQVACLLACSALACSLAQTYEVNRR